MSTRNRDPFLRNAQQFTIGGKIRALPRPARIAVFFSVGFAVGAVVEYFACKTRLYDTIMMRKEERRHGLDEFIVNFRRDIDKWQVEDMRRAGIAPPNALAKQ